MLLLLGLVTLVALDAGGFGNRDTALLTLGTGAVLASASWLRASGVTRGFRSVPIALLFALAGLGVLSLFWTTASFDDALASAMLPAAYGATALSVLALCADPGARALIVPWIAGLSLVAALSGLFGVLAQDTPWATLISSRWRAAGFLEYPPALAFLLIAGLPSWALFASRESGSRRVGAVAALATVALCLGLTGSRLGLGFAGIILVLFLWNRRRSPAGWRPVAAGLLAVAAAIAGLVILAGSAAGPGEGRQGVQGADHGRVALWQDSLPAIAEAPVLGHGAASYFEATRADQEDPTLFAHNLPVESGVELGVPGFVLASALLAACAGICLLWRRTAAAWIYGPGVIAFVLFGLTDWIWHLAGTGAIWAVLLGALCGTRVPAAHPPR